MWTEWDTVSGFNHHYDEFDENYRKFLLTTDKEAKSTDKQQETGY